MTVDTAGVVQPAPRVTILAGAGEDGHRREYHRLFDAMLRKAGVIVDVQRLTAAQVTNPAVVLSLMIEDHALPFLMLAVARALLGRRTVGLLFMPGPCLKPRRTRLRVKRALLRLCRHWPAVSVLTLIPFHLAPGMEAIASGWIYDPQLWDLSPSTVACVPSTALSETISRRAEGRSVIISLGGQTRIKGFDRLAALTPTLAQRFLVVAAGRVDETLGAEAAAFTAGGGLLVDRILGDDEMLSLYGVATWVWACYAPDYDQSSGIFGRAVQTGAPALVRRGALLEKLGDAIGHTVSSLAWSEEATMTATLLALDEPERGREHPRLDLRSI